jgi:hypothetical protein
VCEFVPLTCGTVALIRAGVYLSEIPKFCTQMAMDNCCVFWNDDGYGIPNSSSQWTVKAMLEFKEFISPMVKLDIGVKLNGVYYGNRTPLAEHIIVLSNNHWALCDSPGYRFRDFEELTTSNPEHVDYSIIMMYVIGKEKESKIQL